jgi:hypothetical protein
LNFQEFAIPLLFLAEFVMLGILLNPLKNSSTYPEVREFKEQPFSYSGIAEDIYPVGCTPGKFTPKFRKLCFLQIVRESDCLYDAENDMTHRIMDQAEAYWRAINASSRLSTRFFSSVAQMEKFHLNASSEQLAMGIVFLDENVTTLSYTLRFSSGLMPTSKPFIKENGACLQVD